MRTTIVFFCGVICSLLFAAAAFRGGTPVDYTFTYQGQLRNAGALVNGPVDLRITLWDSDAAGGQVGPINNYQALPITDGRFAVGLNFGGTAFDGSNRWVQLEFRSPAGSGQYLTLNPRDKIMATPYAMFALNGVEGPAGPAGPMGPMGEDGPMGLAGPSGPVGPSGVQGPSGPRGPSGSQGTQGPQGPAGQPGDNFWQFDPASGAATLPAGRVGIGTATPTALLEVVGAPGDDAVSLPQGSIGVEEVVSDMVAESFVTENHGGYTPPFQSPPCSVPTQTTIRRFNNQHPALLVLEGSWSGAEFFSAAGTLELDGVVLLDGVALSNVHRFKLFASVKPGSHELRFTTRILNSCQAGYWGSSCTLSARYVLKPLFE